ncbi:hypothetical protein [Desulforudis sp. DRI-14]|uniref:hypothetical protein n=1 Tax=Desulforudis sp. DRI-14 TaxID=3459793 RepID=UPI0040418320
MTMRQANVEMSNKRLIVVLGMHRSGTSALAGSLSILGCGFDRRLVEASKGDNPKGYWEPIDVVDINNRIFSAFHMSYMDYWPLPSGWEDMPSVSQERECARSWLQRMFDEHDVVVMKDPRLCRTLPLWRQALEDMGADAYYLHVFRHPLEVVASLRKRDARIPKSYGLLAWLAHTLEALEHSVLNRSVLVQYRALLDAPTAVLARVERVLGMNWPIHPEKKSSELRTFLDAGLAHHFANSLHCDTPLEAWAIAVYDLLAGHELRTLDASFAYELQAVSQRFAGVHEICLDMARVLDNEKKNAEAQIRYRDALVDELRAQLDSVKSNTNAQIAYRDKLISELEHRLADVECNANEQIAYRDARLEELRREIEKRDRRLQSARAILSSRRALLIRIFRPSGLGEIDDDK